MNIRFYKEPVITTFVEVEGETFKLNDLFSSLEQIQETNENDRWGDYSLRDYELYHPDVMDKLVNMGLVKNYTGSRMANLYCMKDKNAIKELLDRLYELVI